MLNIFAHFLPFERSGFAPDDYAFLWHAKGMSMKEIVLEAPKYTNRPILYLFGFMLEKAVNLNAAAGLILVLLSSTLLAFAVFLILSELLENQFLAGLGACFYLLLPNKLDMFHTLAYVTLNLVCLIYVLSFLLFIYFVKSNKKTFLFLSLSLYAIAVFWYEVGFLLPVVLFVYCFIYRKEKISATFLFLAPAAFYVIFRMTGAFGLVGSGSIGARDISFTNIFHNIFVMLPNHYFGRYMARAALYGIYRFPSIEMPWPALFAVTDTVLLVLFAKWLSRMQLPKVKPKAVFLAAVVFILFLVPNFFYLIESRHTVLSSVGFTIMCIAALNILGRFWRYFVVIVFALFLVVSQGTSWNQVVACRLNNAVFEYLVEHKNDIEASERVLIDQRSFADNIPYTWGEKAGNTLDCYWGMQAFAPWGLGTMVPLAVGREKMTDVAKARPKALKDKIEYEVQVDGPNTRKSVMPRNGTFIVDYEKVYEGGFVNGNRAGRNK